MRRRDFIKSICGAAARWPVARGWLGVTALEARAQLVTASPVAAQNIANLTVEIVPQIGHSEGVWSVAFSPDGRTIVSGSRDKTLKLWDTASGRVLRTLTGHREVIHAVAFSPDGRMIASGSLDNTLRLWDAVSGRELRTISERGLRVPAVAFSPDGLTIVSKGDGGATFKFWEVMSGRELRAFRDEDSYTVDTFAFSPDGRTIISGNGNTLKLYDEASGRELRTLTGHTDQIQSVAFSPDGRTIVSGSRDKTLKLWDTASGRVLRTLTGHREVIHAVAFSPDGRMIVSGGDVETDSGIYNNTLKLWDVASGRELRTITGHVGSVHAVAVSPDGRTIVSAGSDDMLKLWDVSTTHELHTLTGRASSVNAVAFWPQGNTIVTGGTQTLRFWEVASGRTQRVLTVPGAYGTNVAFSPDGRTIAAGGKLWDDASGRELRTLIGYDGIGRNVFSPDGRMIASVGGINDTTVTLWDVASGRELHILTGHGDDVQAVAFSPDGHTIVTGSSKESGSLGDTLKLWDAATGRELRTLWGAGWVSAVACSPDGRTIVSGSWDETLKLWDAVSHRELRTLAGHHDYIENVAFSPDGRTIVSGSRDKTLKLWDTASGRVLRTLAGHHDWIEAVAFSPDGRMIVSASKDTTIRRWNLAGDLLATSIAASDGEWLTITPEGFFDASAKGADMLSAVRGFEVYSIDQFYQQLYRPDVVRQKLSMDVDINQRVKAAASNINLDIILASKAPPEITIVSPSPESKIGGISITVEANLTDRGAEKGGGIGRIEWRVNDVTRAVQDLQQNSDGKITKVRQKLALPDETSEIKVVAYNKANLAASSPASISVTVKSATPRPKPQLHVLAIGVNEYRDPAIEGLNYSVADAKSVVAAFSLSKSDKTVYEDVVVHGPLLNGEATAPNLKREFERLSTIVRPDDVFVLYIAGHGVTDDGRYYFVAHDAKIKNAKLDIGTSIGQDQLQQWLTLIPAFKSALFYDTCESGSIAEDRSAFRSSRQLAAAEKLSRSMGRTVISATSDVKDALEGYPPDARQKHGIFTYVLLDALALADTNTDGDITTEALGAYLQKYLPDLTEKLSNFRQEPQVKLSGAPFVLVKRADIAEINKVR